MIKGINRQVIEITNTGSNYYEKAWLVVKPEYSYLHQSMLEREAKKIIKDTGEPSCMKAKRNFGFWLLRLGISAACGAGVSLLITSLF